jgi:hypothetical protein
MALACRRHTAGSTAGETSARLSALLEQRRRGFPIEKRAKKRVDALQQDLDTLYARLVEMNDIAAFEAALAIEDPVAASVGVFGIMEIVNRNYSMSPESKNLRAEGLSELARLTSHSNPHVRGAALYALGMMRRHEHQAVAAGAIDDRARCHIFFPPFATLDHGLTTSVDTMAHVALERMRGTREAAD